MKKIHPGLLVALIAAIGMFAFAMSYRPESAATNAATVAPIQEIVTLEIIPMTESIETYTVPFTQGSTAFSALLDASTSNRFSVTYDPPGEFGVFVKGIDGAEGTQDAYWLYAINGVAGEVAADTALLKAGDRVTWTYTQAE